jgi:hypothetical protein
MLGRLGGFIGLVISVAALIVGQFSTKLYNMTLLSYFYKVENADHDNDKTVKNNQVQDYSQDLPRLGTSKRMGERADEEEEKEGIDKTIDKNLNNF